MTEQHTLCHTCTVAVENADMTVIDDRDLATVEKNIDRMGWVAVTNVQESLNFDCDCCEQKCIGWAYTVEPVNGIA